MDLDKDSKQASEKLKENGPSSIETEDNLSTKDKENKHMVTTLFILHGKELNISILTISETRMLWTLLSAIKTIKLIFNTRLSEEFSISGSY